MTKEELLQVAKEVVEAGSNGAYRNLDYLLSKAVENLDELRKNAAYRNTQDRLMAQKIEELQEKIDRVSELMMRILDNHNNNELRDDIDSLREWKK